MQPLKVPEWKYDSISMDFAVGLSRKHGGRDPIWVIVDSLTKSTHLLVVKTTYKDIHLVRLFIVEIVRLQCIPSSIVSYRDLKITSRFCAEFQHGMGLKLCFSTLNLPQTYDQTERMIQTLEDMLKARVLECG